MVKKIGFVPLLLIVLGLTGYLLLVLVYCIPTERIERNVRDSANIFEREDTYHLLIRHGNSQLDNYTDALMLLIAAYPSQDLWSSPINARHYTGEPCQVLVDVYRDGETGNTVTFARYWHGYLLFLKPLLTFFNYSTIRYMMIFAQMGLFVLIIYKLSQRNKEMIIPTFLFWIFLNPVATMMSLQFNSVLIVTFLAMLVVLYVDEHWKAEDGLYVWGVLFLLFGVLTNYIDLLTYPLVTLGVPLILWLSIRLSPDIRENVKRILASSLFWFIGYGGMWELKWLLGSIITGENIFAEAYVSMLIRTSSSYSDMTFDFWDIMERQWEAARNSVWKLALIALFVYWLYKVLRVGKIHINLLVPYMIVAIYPFVWYFVMKNHSFLHYFFTYRELAISLYAFAAMCVAVHKGERGNKSGGDMNERNCVVGKEISAEFIDRNADKC